MFKVNNKDTKTMTPVAWDLIASEKLTFHETSLEDMGQFYWALGDLKLSVTSAGVHHMRNLQFFTFEEDNKVFSIGREGGVPSPLFKNLLMPPHQYMSPQDSPTKFLFPPPKVHPELNNNFQIITK